MANYLLGLEWSPNNFKLACLRQEGNKYRFEKLESLSVPPNNPEEAREILKQWVSDNLPSAKDIRVVLTLPESEVFLKELELPKTGDKELSEAVFWEVSSFAPVDPQDSVIQWQKLSEEEKTVHLAVMVVKDETVTPLASMIQKAGFQLLAIEPYSLSFARLSQTKLEKTTLLVNAGEAETNFVILKKGFPVFSNSISTFLSSMKTKRRRLDREIATSLSANAKKVISFWEEKNEGKVQQVVITGEGIRYFGLATAINNLVHVPTVFGKIKKILEVVPSAQTQTTFERYLIAIGAAVRLFSEDQLLEPNFLQKEERKIQEKGKRQNEIFKGLSFLAKITLVFLALNFLILSGLKIWQSSLNKEIAQAKLFVNNHPAQKLSAEVQADNQMLSQVDWLVGRQKDTGDRLRQIASLTPSDIRYTSLGLAGLKSEEWKISGVGNREAILAFYEKLKASSGAKQVSMPYSNLQKETEGDFKITIIW